VHSDDEHEPLGVAWHMRLHVAIEPPQLSHRPLHITRVATITRMQ